MFSDPQIDSFMKSCETSIFFLTTSVCDRVLVEPVFYVQAFPSFDCKFLRMRTYFKCIFLRMRCIFKYDLSSNANFLETRFSSPQVYADTLPSYLHEGFRVDHCGIHSIALSNDGLIATGGQVRAYFTRECGGL